MLCRSKPRTVEAFLLPPVCFDTERKHSRTALKVFLWMRSVFLFYFILAFVSSCDVEGASDYRVFSINFKILYE